MSTKKQRTEVDRETEEEEEELTGFDKDQLTHVDEVSILVSKLQKQASNDDVQSLSLDTKPDSVFWETGEIKVALVLVFQYLDAPTMNACARVSKMWNECTKHSLIWRTYCLKFFGVTAIPNDTDWISVFRMWYDNIKESWMYGGNACRSFVFRSHECKSSMFLPPLLCKVPIAVNTDDVQAIYGTHLYACNSDDQALLQIRAYDLVSSRQLWCWKNDIPNTEYIWAHHIVADQHAVYVRVDDSLVIALDSLTGALLWKKQTTQLYDMFLYNSDLIFVDGTSGSLVGWDKATGEQMWKIQPFFKVTEKESSNYHSGCSIIGKFNGYFYWRVYQEICIASISDKRLLIIKNINNLCTIDESDVVTELAVHDGKLYMATFGTDGNVFCFQVNFDEKDVSLLWSVDVDLEMELEEEVPIVVHAGVVWVFFAFSETIIGLDAITGEELLRTSVQTGYINDVNQLKPYPMYVLNDILYYAITNDNQSVFCVGAINTISRTNIWRSYWRHDVRMKTIPVGHKNVKLMLGSQDESTLLVLWHP